LEIKKIKLKYLFVRPYFRPSCCTFDSAARGGRTTHPHPLKYFPVSRVYGKSVSLREGMKKMMRILVEEDEMETAVA
jgi:hypothetical protein